MSWLSKLFRRARKESIELQKAREQANISEERLRCVNEQGLRVTRVANSLEHKKLRNGWGEVIADTMRRSK